MALVTLIGNATLPTWTEALVGLACAYVGEVWETTLRLDHLDFCHRHGEAPAVVTSVHDQGSRRLWIDSAAFHDVAQLTHDISRRPADAMDILPPYTALDISRRRIIQTDRTHDSSAHRRLVMDAILCGVASRSVQALQQASTMAS